MEKLGTDRMSKTKIIGDNEVKQSFYGQLVSGKGVSSGLDEQLAKEVSKAGKRLSFTCFLPCFKVSSVRFICFVESASAEKQRIAEAVASMLKLKVELNTTSSERYTFCVLLLLTFLTSFILVR